MTRQDNGKLIEIASKSQAAGPFDVEKLEALLTADLP